MRQFFVLCCLFVLGCAGVDPVSHPRPASAPADYIESITLPDDGDMRTAAVPNAAWAALQDNTKWLATGSTIIHANLATTNGGLGKKVFVTDGAAGWYFWAVAIPVGAPDGDRVVTCTAASGGVWVHEDYFASRNKKRAAIGPLPGDNFATVTQAGKINKEVVDHGYFTHDIGGQAGYSVTQTAAVTPTVSVTDLGNLHVGDIVKFSITAWAHFTVEAGGTARKFFAYTEYSQDAGATWHTLHSAVPQFQCPGANLSEQLPSLAFTRPVSVAGDFQIRIMAYVLNAGDTLDLEIATWMAEVIRP